MDSLGNETLLLTTLHVFARLSLFLGACWEAQTWKRKGGSLRGVLYSYLSLRGSQGEGKTCLCLGVNNAGRVGDSPFPFITVMDWKRKKQRSFIIGYFSCKTPPVSRHSKGFQRRSHSYMNRASGHNLLWHLEFQNLWLVQYLHILQEKCSSVETHEVL